MEADSLEERILILALCGWRLRRSEIAALADQQFEPETNDLNISFQDRKNVATDDDEGVTVPIIYVRAIVADCGDQFSNRDEWNGFLFPSLNAATGHAGDDRRAVSATGRTRGCDGSRRDADVTIRLMVLIYDAS